MNWLRSWLLGPQGSVYAGKIDDLYMVIFYLCIFFFLLIFVLTIGSVIVWRKRPGRKTPHITDNLPLELAWSIIPLLLCMGLFFWGVQRWMEAEVAPNEALEITVTAKKWQWAFEYPDGTRTLNEVHLPINKPARFIMSSEDVLHDFFVPDMRVKHDIVPGRYTEIWFTPTVPGLHHATCAEYCGKGHSDMQAKVFVDNPEQYAKWVLEGGDEWKTMTPKEYGLYLYQSKGCETCHTLDGTKLAQGGPSWKGIFGKMEKMSDGKEYKVDENYIRESMMAPSAKIVMGYENIMPTFQGLLREREINALVAFIKMQK
jgi:cytochrome c oxidase subunit II